MTFRPSPLFLTDEDLNILLNQMPKLPGDTWVKDICENGRNFDPPYKPGFARDYVLSEVLKDDE